MDDSQPDLERSALTRALESEPNERVQTFLAIACAGILHGAVALLVPRHTANPRPVIASTQIEVLEPPPPIKPEPPKPEPEPDPPPQTSKAVQPRAPSKTAAPPPARAAAVLTQKDDPDAPADLSNMMVVGDAETFTGGPSSAEGTTQRTVVVAGTGTGDRGSTSSPPAPAPGVDRSQRAHLAGGATWNCPFPAEADATQMDHAVVTLRITVSVVGAPVSVVVTADPGSGFGREARACVMSKRFEPALDRDGKATEGTSLVNVRFDR